MRCKWWRVELGEVSVFVSGIHGCDFLRARSTHHFENFADLVLGITAWEKWSHFEEFGNYAACCPNINLLIVECLAKLQLRRSIVARADVGHRCIVIVDLFG